MNSDTTTYTICNKIEKTSDPQAQFTVSNTFIQSQVKAVKRAFKLKMFCLPFTGVNLFILFT